MSLTPVPTLPALPADGATGDDFNDPAIAFFQALRDDTLPALNTFITEVQDFVAAAFTATSTTSVAIGTGSKVFTLAADAAFAPGQTVIAANDASNYMIGMIAAYDSGTDSLTISVGSGDAIGSGTYASWTISLALSSDLTDYLAKAGGTMTGLLTLAAAEGLLLTPGSDPGSPSNGQVWANAAGTALIARLNGASYTLASTAAAQEIPIPATAMTPRTTNGAASGSSETTTNKIMVETLDYDQSTNEYAQVRIPMPKRWNEGTFTCRFLWTATTTGNVVWYCRAVAISNDDPMDAAFGTAIAVIDGVTAANDLMISADTNAITAGGTPAEADLVVFEFYRDAANGSDTLAADAKLLGVVLTLTTDAGDDS